ncbi:putative LaeA-like methyltransferase [Talaromyces proteolyticus]|uniref:LaeA-like methyltransferase n=1 Tax=Talaromyces proteolyticus TaxID=1131652 RepID=A0AAD4L4T6_9EURO|nr:putative LaeA-like methyltransferase [Talaromyces proteolyticus]KAH8704218.1 putative LaeA-like methyltransferase [Talaromyces proteolyticus]
MATETEGHYILNRDATESTRLDEQHTLLTELAGGSPIHSRIAIDNIHAIADIATGTGVWLKHICTLLKDIPTDRPRYFHGFDISDSQFPREHAGIHFSVQDITKPFSDAHLNRYDLVHVRLLFCGLKKSEYEIAVANLMTLLKPGGFLQWDEIDYHALTQLNQENPRFFEIMKIVNDGLNSAQYSDSAPKLLKQTFKRKGLVKITSHDYVSSEQPRSAEIMQKWLHNALRMLIPWALETSEKEKGVDSTNQKSANEIIKEMGTIFAAKLVPRGEVSVVVGQKKGQTFCSIL